MNALKLAALLGALSLSAAAPQAQEHLASPHLSHGANVTIGGGAVQVGIRLPHIGRRSYPTPRPYCPPTRVHKVWVPGRWVTESRPTWRPAVTSQVYVPATYQTHYDVCGNPYQVLLCAAHYEAVTTPGHWEQCSTRVWRPGRWESQRY